MERDTCVNLSTPRACTHECAPAHQQVYTHRDKKQQQQLKGSWFQGHGLSCPEDIAAGGWLLAHMSADQEAGSPSRTQDQFTTHKAYSPSNPLPLSRHFLKVPQPPETAPRDGTTHKWV